MELYINDFNIDLKDSIPFPLTFQISDIRDLDKRKGNNSKTIVVPGTRNNMRIFSTVYTLSTDSKQFGGPQVVYNFDPSIKAPARAYKDGVLQFSGVARLTKCKKNASDKSWEFHVVLLSDSIDYMSDFKRIKIRELGWSEFNHKLIYARQSETWAGTVQKNGSPYSIIDTGQWTGEGYYYGLIDYGYDRAAADAFEPEHIPPQIFKKQILDKLFETYDLTYTSTFLNSQKYKKQLFAYEGGPLPNIDPVIATNNSIETDQINNAGYVVNGTVAAQSIYGVMIPIDGLVANGAAVADYVTEYNSNSGTNVDPGNHIQDSEPLTFIASSEGDYVLDYSGTHDVTVDWNFTNGNPDLQDFRVDVQAFIYTYVNGVQYTADELYDAEGSLVSYPWGSPPSIAVNFSYSKDLYLEISDVVEFKIRYRFRGLISATEAEGNQWGTTGDYTFQVTATGCELDVSYEQQQIITGATINVKQFLSKMDGATFFKGEVQKHNLYVMQDPVNPKNLLIEPWNDFYKGSDNAINWTDKLDTSKDIDVTPTINFSTREYIFGFQNDKDYWNERYFNDVNEQYGSKTLVSASQFAKGKTEVKLPYSNKIICRIPDTDLLVPRSFTVKTHEDDISEIVPKKGKPFTVQILKGALAGTDNMRTGAWTLIDENGVDQVQTTYPYVGHLDDPDDPTYDLMFGLPSYVFYDLDPAIGYTTNNLYLGYERFIRETLDKNGKMLTAHFMLNDADINTLDFAELINIHGVIYRLNKVENYDGSANKSTKCELIRIIEGESIQTNIVEELTPGLTNDDPFEIPSFNYKRVTEDGFERRTEDGLNTRRIETST